MKLKSFFNYLALTIISGLLLIWSLQQKPPYITQDFYSEPYIQYTLKSRYTDNRNIYEPSYPYVSTSPLSLKYAIIRLYERLNASYTPNFYAAKRIAELEKWGREMPFNIWQNNLEDFSDLEKIWLKQQQDVDANLYSLHLVVYKSHLLNYEYKVKQIIADTNKSNKEKK